MTPPKLSASVGEGARNKPIDVAVVKVLLQKVLGSEALVSVDGEADDDLSDAIGGFTNRASSAATPAPNVSAGARSFGPAQALAAPTAIRPHDRTWQALVAAAGASFDPVTTLRKLVPNDAAFTAASVGAMTDLYRRQEGVAPPDLTTLSTFIASDQQVRDLRWFAYMLGTAWLETAYTYEPIRERGLGRQFYYGVPTPFTDRLGHPYNFIYYGRGYVQLTLLDNYLSMGKRLGIDQQLATSPDDVLQPNMAYTIMSIGMREGMFTHISQTVTETDSRGRPRPHRVLVPQRLGTFIAGDLCDYYHARRIINLKDFRTYQPIADKALEHELLLKLTILAAMKE